MRQGEPGDSLMLVLRGEVEVSVRGYTLKMMHHCLMYDPKACRSGNQAKNTLGRQFVKSATHRPMRHFVGASHTPRSAEIDPGLLPRACKDWISG